MTNFYLHGINQACLPNSQNPPCSTYGANSAVDFCTPYLVVGLLLPSSAAAKIYFLDPSSAAFGYYIDDPGTNCHNVSSPYYRFYDAGLINGTSGITACSTFNNVKFYALDVLAAYRKGAWASSLSIDIHASAYLTSTAQAATLVAGWVNTYYPIFSVMLPQCKSAYLPRLASCARNKIGSISIYDDATFTLA